MRIFVTNADSPTGQRIVSKLSSTHQVVAFGDRPGVVFPEGVSYTWGDLRESEQVSPKLEGIDAIVHLSPLTVTESPDSDALTAIDHATRGTYVLLNAARECGVSKIVQASSLDLFERFPSNYRINESWRPRPTPSTADLCAWLGELSARENARAGGLQVICLRFGHIVDDAHIHANPYDPRWLHLDDAAHGIDRALASLAHTDGQKAPFWRVYHIAAPGAGAKVRLSDSASSGEPFNYRPVHELATAIPPTPEHTLATNNWEHWLAPKEVPSRPVRNVVIFGACGPVAAMTALELSSSYRLRLVDVRSIADVIAESKPQMPGAPLPQALGAPHVYQLVDVRDPQQVSAACEGMDAIINLTVLRHDPADAFRVNTQGAINIMQAAVKHGIRRVVQTGPLVHGTAGDGDYSTDYDVVDDAPPRPFNSLYIHSKYLGQEACRVYAEYHGLEVPTLLFGAFVNLKNPGSPNHTFAVTWEDSARAIRRALELVTLPSPYEVFNITSDTPLARFNNAKAKTVLGWIPRDRMVNHWSVY